MNPTASPHWPDHGAGASRGENTSIGSVGHFRCAFARNFIDSQGLDPLLGRSENDLASSNELVAALIGGKRGLEGDLTLLEVAQTTVNQFGGARARTGDPEDERVAYLREGPLSLIYCKSGSNPRLREENGGFLSRASEMFSE